MLKKMNVCKWLAMISVLCLFGCNSTEKVLKPSMIDIAKNEATAFFMVHPEYTNSKGKENLLFEIFKSEVKKPENRHKSILELLNESHSQLVVLDHFEKNEDIS
ncbi:hypothetical protein DU52_08270 [Methanosarcina mazei]|uniref:Uncharacterized protein n=1 Tax=Methanosarcina mazei TaxID=2209 RepID=A0A0F8DJ30_METMZ|nr:hypothetical protein [Methanosarcina mazei]KKG27596.1 hypothetical protein DU52_08270 [Methanosarcina mazei]